MTLPDAASPDPSADHLMTRCPTCSAQLAYVPGTTSLQCGSCGTNLVFEEADIAAGRAYDAWAGEHAAGAATRPATVTMQCEGCGALTDSESVATTCQFCASHLVALSAAPGMVMPDAVLPFAVTAAAAKEKFRRWVGHQFFGVKALKKVNAEESLVGTYLPYWSVSTDTETQWAGKRGVDHEERRSNGGTETTTNWSDQSGTLTRRFDDTFVPGKEQDLDLTVAFSTLKTDDLVAYQPEYLAGFSTARYDIDPTAAVESAKGRVAGQIRGDVKRAIGGDRQKIEHLQTAYSAITFRLVLVPVWMMTFMFAGKRWPIVISGQTGAVYGKFPVNRVKMVLTVAAMFAVVIIATLLFMKMRA